MLDNALSGSVPVGTVRPESSTISKVVTLVAVVVPPLGLLSAMGLLWGVAFHPVDLVLLVALYVTARSGRRSASTATSRTAASARTRPSRRRSRSSAA